MKTCREWNSLAGTLTFVILFGISLACMPGSPIDEDDSAAETELLPEAINFGFVEVTGSSSETIEARVDPETASFPHAYELSMLYDNTTITFAGGATSVTDTLTEAEPSADHPVFFTPQEPGTFVAQVWAEEPGARTPDTIDLIGWGVEGCRFSRNEISFGNVEVGSAAVDTFVLRNATVYPHQQDVTIRISIPSCGDVAFLVEDNEVHDTMEWTLAAGQTAICTLQFAPTVEEIYLCTLQTIEESYCGPLVVEGIGVTDLESEWMACESGTSADLHAIDGAADGTLVAVGDAETVLFAAVSSPCVWAPGPAPDLQSGTASLRAVWILDLGNVWVAANGAGTRYIIARNDDVWNIHDQTVLVESYDCGWGSSYQNIYFAGMGVASDMPNGRRFDGGGWNDVIIDMGMSEVTGIGGSGSQDMWAVLDQPSYNLWHGAGGVWEDRSVPWIGAGLQDVWVDAAGEAFAVGDGGAIYHYDGNVWADQSLTVDTPPDLFAVWGLSPTDVYAVGAGAAIYHYDGASWSREDQPAGVTAALRDVWMSASGDAWAVGDGGVILHRP